MEYFFHPDKLPENYLDVVKLPKDADMSNYENFRVGITSYFDFYSHEEMTDMER